MADSALAPHDSNYNDELSTGGKIFKFLSWSSFALVCLIFFTVIKIPQMKIHRYAIGMINQQLSSSGIELSADEGRIALGLGISYEMTGVRLTKNETGKILKISKISVSPSFTHLLQGKLGAAFHLEEGPGVLDGSIAARGEEFEFSLQTPGVNLGRLGVLPFLANLEGTAEIKGDVQLSGTLSSMSSMNGAIKLNLSKITIDGQSFMGFSLPRMSIGDGVVDVTMNNGKATLNSVRLGKPGGSDDLFISSTGDVKLSRTLDGSDLNLRMKVGFSPTVMKSFSLLDALLGSMKQADGTYAFKLQGPASSTMPLPDK